MATIYNSELTKELVNAGKIQTSRDSVPNQLAEKVVPVMEVNPKLLRRINVIKQAVCSNATSATIYTVPTDRDFYLTNGAIALIKDATSTSTAAALSVVLDGESSGTSVLVIPCFTLTAQTAELSQSWGNTPIKLSRGSNIAVTSTTNVANISIRGAIQGYTVDNTNA